MIVSSKLRVKFLVVGGRTFYPEPSILIVPFAAPVSSEDPMELETRMKKFNVVAYKLNFGEASMISYTHRVSFDAVAQISKTLRSSYDVVTPEVLLRRRGPRVIRAVEIPGTLAPGHLFVRVTTSYGALLAYGVFELDMPAGVELQWDRMYHTNCVVEVSRDGQTYTSLGTVDEGVITYA